MRPAQNRAIQAATGAITGATQIPDQLKQMIDLQIAAGRSASEADHVPEAPRADAGHPATETEAAAMADRTDASKTLPGGTGYQFDCVVSEHIELSLMRLLCIRACQVGICTQYDASCLSRGGHHLLSMSAQSSWPRNRLLLALPASNLRRLLPELERIHCRSQQVLVDADSPLNHVFFPDSGVVSVVAVYSDGSIIEMATIGREGCSDAQAIFGARTSSVRLLVQIPGDAAKMSRAAFSRAMASMPAFRGLMYSYAQAFLEQVMVSVACNGAHSLKQRLARWLLMMRDRGDDDTLRITQSLLAEMLGVQRPSITNAARELERAGLIARGLRQVTILDRRGLVGASCECYQLVRARVASLLPKTYG